MTLQTAIELHQAGKLDEAEAIYNKIIENDPNNPNIPHLLGLIHHQSGRNDLAIEFIKKSIQIAPNSPLLYSNLGSIFKENDQIDEAIDCYRTALKLKPDYVEVHYNLGNIFMNIGNLEAAIHSYRQTLLFNPDYASAHYNLGIALKNQKNFDQANPCFKRAMELGFLGRWIYHHVDRYGVIEVINTDGMHVLHFGNFPIAQSTMTLSDRDAIQPRYMRAMLTPLIFIDEPSHVLILGLGAGNLAKFLLKHFASCTIDAIELREKVAQVAQDYFYLPQTERLNIIIADAQAFLKQKAPTRPYDLILIDVFNAQGIDESIHTADFFQNCSKLLAPKGALSINLWDSDEASLNKAKTLIPKYFQNDPLLVTGITGNIIGIGFGNEVKKPKLQTHCEKIAQLEEKLGVEMNDFFLNLSSI